MNAVYFKGYLLAGAVDVLATEYPLASYCQKSEPQGGSPCGRTAKINPEVVMRDSVRVVSKRNGDYVVYYPDIVVKFWKKR